MRRAIVKHFLYYAAIVLFVTSLWAVSGFYWMNAVVSAEYAPAVRETLNHLAGGMISEKIHRPRIEGLLNTLMRRQDLIFSAVVHGDGTLTYARSFQRRTSVLWPLRVSYPLYKGKDVIGWLRIWPAPESLYTLFIETSNRYVIVLFAVSWFVCVLAPLFIFLWLFVFVPLRYLKAGADALEREEPMPDARLGYAEWRDLYRKLAVLGVRTADTNETLNMLFTVSQTLTSHLDITDTFNIIMGTAQKKFPGILAAIFLQRDDEFLSVRAHRGFSSDFARSVHFKPGEGLGGQAFQKVQTVVVNDCARDARMAGSTLMENEGIGSFMHIPLIAEGKCVGLLNISSRQTGFFDENKQKTFALIAKYISIVIRNAQLYERVQELNRRLETEVSSTTQELVQTNARLIQKVREMKALSDISLLAGAQQDLPAVLNAMVEKITGLLSVQTAGVFLYNEESREMVPTSPFFGIRQEDFAALRVPAQEPAALWAVVNEGRNFLFNDPAEATRAMPVLGSLLSMHSLLMVSLRAGRKNIGVLVLANKINGLFTQDDLHIVELIADRISGIIENMSLSAQRESHVRELTVLQKISAAISSEPVCEKILTTIISVTTQAFNADVCYLSLYDPQERAMVTQPGAYAATPGTVLPPSISVGDTHSLTVMVYKTGEVFFSSDVMMDPRVTSPYVRTMGLKSMIILPLRAENKVIGALIIGRQQANAFSREHLRLLTLIAHQAAIIIENAQLYENLRETKGELEQLNQIKNDFISMVSHELRTPITAIKGFVKVVLGKEAGSINAQQEKFLEIADRSIDRLSLLIADLLDISRIEAGQLALHLGPVDAASIVEEIIHSGSHEARRRKLTVTAHIPPSFPPVMADRGRLIQVFDNLIMNAMKFTPDGGTITVGALDKGDVVLFSVADSGIGLDKSEHQKIFQKFYQTGSGPAHTTPGTGLGLAIVKSIVEMHGGEIWVDSEPGRGSTFYFVIPRAKNDVSEKHKR